MKFSFNLGNIFNFFKNLKNLKNIKQDFQKEQEAERKYFETLRENYNKRKDYVYSSGMFNLIEHTFIAQKININNDEKYDHGIVDICIHILCDMRPLTKDNLIGNYCMGWECATGVELPQTTYSAMVDLLLNNVDELNKYKKDYQTLNL